MNNVTCMRAVWGAAAMAVVAAVYSSGDVRAQAGRSTADGVYAEAQAVRGEKLYADECSICHRNDLSGTAVAPSLAGTRFESSWGGQPLGALYERIATTMPQTAPGTLKPEQAADVVAYLLKMSKAPAGPAELGTKVEELKLITIQAAQ